MKNAYEKFASDFIANYILSECSEDTFIGFERIELQPRNAITIDFRAVVVEDDHPAGTVLEGWLEGGEIHIHNGYYL